MSSLSLLLFGAALFLVDSLLVQKARLRAENEALTFSSAVRESILRTASSAYALAALVHHGEGSVERFYEVAPRMLAYYPGIYTLVLLPEGVVSHIYPLEGNERALGHDQFADPARIEIARLTRDSREMTLTDPVHLIQGPLASIARLPVFFDDGDGEIFWGFSSCTILFPDVLENASIDAFGTTGLQYVLWRHDGASGEPLVIHASGTDDVAPILESGLESEVRILNAEWRLSVLPEGGWRNGILLALLALGAVGLSLLLAIVARLIIGIRRSEEQYRLLADNAKDVIWTMSLPDLRFTYISPSVSGLTGFSVEEAMSQSIDEALEPESARRVAEANAEHLRLLREGKTSAEGYLTEVRQRCKDGSVIWVGVRSGYILDEAGEPVGILGVSRDISEIKRTQQALEEANATKKTFLAVIAHDLRGSLGGITQSLELVQQDYESMDGCERREYLTTATEEARRTFRLLENLLAWSSSQLDQIAFNPLEGAVRPLVEENLELLRTRAAEKGLLLANAVPEGLTAPFDGAMIDTVLRNLLGNALKFTPRGGRVEVGARRTEEGVEICVRDSGPGVPPEIAEALFRIDAKRSSAKGTGGERGSGLGLVLCKEFVEKHGGRIWYESAPGGGSLFVFLLPDRPAQ